MCIKQTRERIPAIPTFCTGEELGIAGGAHRVLAQFLALIRRLLPGYPVGSLSVNPVIPFRFPGHDKSCRIITRR